MLVGAADQAGAPSDLLSNLLPPLLKLHELVEFEEQRDGASPLLPALRAALRDMDQAFAAHGVLRVAAVPGSPIDMADHEVAQLAVVGGVAAADLTALGDAVVHECLRPAYVHLSSGSVLKRALVTAERRPHELVDRLEPPRRLAGLTHAVQPGDTLQGLAVRYGVRVSAISRANNLASAQSMHARKELHIPPSATAGGSDAPGSGRPGLAATHVAGGAARIAVSAAQGQLTGPATAAPAAAPPSGCADMGAAVGATPRPTVLPPTPRGGQSGAVDTRSDAEQELARQEWFRYYCGARDWDGAESMAVTDADARTIARLRMLAAVPTRMRCTILLFLIAVAQAYVLSPLPARPAGVCRTAKSPKMMPKFIKDLFPDMPKPEDAMADLKKMFSFGKEETPPAEPEPEEASEEAPMDDAASNEWTTSSYRRDSLA